MFVSPRTMTAHVILCTDTDLGNMTTEISSKVGRGSLNPRRSQIYVPMLEILCLANKISWLRRRVGQLFAELALAPLALHHCGCST